MTSANAGGNSKGKQALLDDCNYIKMWQVRYGTNEMKTCTLGLSGYRRVLKIMTIFINF